jgi:hypothetical protein
LIESKLHFVLESASFKVTQKYFLGDGPPQQYSPIALAMTPQQLVQLIRIRE